MPIYTRTDRIPATGEKVLLVRLSSDTSDQYAYLRDIFVRDLSKALKTIEAMIKTGSGQPDFIIFDLGGIGGFSADALSSLTKAREFIIHFDSFYEEDDENHGPRISRLEHPDATSIPIPMTNINLDSLKRI